MGVRRQGVGLWQSSIVEAVERKVSRLQKTLCLETSHGLAVFESKKLKWQSAILGAGVG